MLVCVRLRKINIMWNTPLTCTNDVYVYIYIFYGLNKFSDIPRLTTCQFPCLTTAIKSVLNIWDILVSMIVMTECGGEYCTSVFSKQLHNINVNLWNVGEVKTIITCDYSLFWNDNDHDSAGLSKTRIFKPIPTGRAVKKENHRVYLTLGQ